MYKKFIGKYALIRSRNEGINAGEIVALDSTGVADWEEISVNEKQQLGKDL